MRLHAAWPVAGNLAKNFDDGGMRGLNDVNVVDGAACAAEVTVVMACEGFALMVAELVAVTVAACAAEEADELLFLVATGLDFGAACAAVVTVDAELVLLFLGDANGEAFEMCVGGTRHLDLLRLRSCA